jgi:hypothetical protein
VSALPAVRTNFTDPLPGAFTVANSFDEFDEPEDDDDDDDDGNGDDNGAGQHGDVDNDDGLGVGGIGPMRHVSAGSGLDAFADEIDGDDFTDSPPQKMVLPGRTLSSDNMVLEGEDGFQSFPHDGSKEESSFFQVDVEEGTQRLCSYLQRATALLVVIDTLCCLSLKRTVQSWEKEQVADFLSSIIGLPQYAVRLCLVRACCSCAAWSCTHHLLASCQLSPTLSRRILSCATSTA